MHSYIVLHPADTVAVALSPLEEGTLITLNQTEFTLKEAIPQGHKFALCDIKADSKVIKYGNPIGIAKEDILQGAHIHTHNLKTALNDLLTYIYTPTLSVPMNPMIKEERSFWGYRRENGRVGIRNELWIIPTVGCVNSVAKQIEASCKHLVCENIDAVVAFPHPYGCSQMGDDQEHTRQILANLANHPNAGGVLVLGLGCENSGVEEIKKHMGNFDPNRVRFLVAQDCEDEIASSIELLEELAHYASQFKREPIPCSELVIGLKCGGSDGLSGITANPIVGRFSDELIAQGGSTILTEVPEMFGAETLLMNRCANEALFQKTVDLINDFKNYYTKNGQTIYENPSPGNKKGGISTLEDKSLGCTQKSGSAPVSGVLSYGDVISEKGLHLLSAPGNDLVAATALAASGAHMVLFTTGRGTPFSCPVPTMKIATNNQLTSKKQNWIDFNCGVLLDGISFEELTLQLFDFVCEIASGKQVISERMGYHDMAIFKQGVTL